MQSNMSTRPAVKELNVFPTSMMSPVFSQIDEVSFPKLSKINWLLLGITIPVLLRNLIFRFYSPIHNSWQPKILKYCFVQKLHISRDIFGYNFLLSMLCILVNLLLILLINFEGHIWLPFLLAMLCILVNLLLFLLITYAAVNVFRMGHFWFFKFGSAHILWVAARLSSRVYCLMLTSSFNASLYRFCRFLYVAGSFGFRWVICCLCFQSARLFNWFFVCIVLRSFSPLSTSLSSSTLCFQFARLFNWFFCLHCFVLLFSSFHVPLFFGAFLSVYWFMLTSFFNASFYRFRRFFYVAENFGRWVICCLCFQSACLFNWFFVCFFCAPFLPFPRLSLFWRIPLCVLFDANLFFRSVPVRFPVNTPFTQRGKLYETRHLCPDNNTIMKTSIIIPTPANFLKLYHVTYLAPWHQISIT